MYEGAAKEITEADFNAALKFGQEAASRSSPRKRNWPPRPARKNAKSRSTSFPTKFWHEAKKLAGDRFVPALLTPGKLAREAAVQGDSGRSRREARRKIRRGKSHRVRHQGRLLLHPEGSRPQIDFEQRQAPDGRAFDVKSARFPAKSAFCRARTARRFSPAAKPRPSRSPRSAPATTRRNLIPTPAARPRRNSSCTTTSRISPSAKPAASAVRAAAKSATARSPNAASSR
jgi:hypothetical protein